MSKSAGPSSELTPLLAANNQQWTLADIAPGEVSHSTVVIMTLIYSALNSLLNSSHAGLNIAELIFSLISISMCYVVYVAQAKKFMSDTVQAIVRVFGFLFFMLAIMFEIMQKKAISPF